MPEFDFSIFPTLTTARLILRQSMPEDAADLFSYQSDPEVMKYDSPSVPMKEVAEAGSEIESSRQRFIDKKGITWSIVLKSESRNIGGIGFYFWDKSYYKADLGYTLARPYWRQGITTEALRAIIRFGFESMHLHRINADTRMDNIASTRLLEKLGFMHEGTRRECILNEDGSYQSWGLFGMLEQEYHPGNLLI
jgi:ribosomal-protein-alanine N-acetyltransferase